MSAAQLKTKGREDREAYQRGLAHNPAATHYNTLKQRRDWLTARIGAKLSIGWDVDWDTAERDALTWSLEKLEQMGEG